ncbi:GvpL/GvpF family gas vesicle protein [Pseudonocardia parietis]|uniref:Gas vesicle protein GvpL/GvpF n=1 Tax=Pseudonocardia parietis TaxID=570936 RepID=A0ABS4W1F1_9PSEU|nr:GvpL/GvpF family gas vesicle protein [Pseudonocardia parietis]MBP2369996.1 hypothetical protein [Pseudonocardia parietis]
MTDDPTYLYAAGEGAPPDLPAGLTGVADRPLRIVRGDRLWAAVSTVPSTDFTQDVLQERLEDITWLATTARAHHHVVDELGRLATLAPMALATVYLDDDRVHSMLEEREAELGAVLERLHGHAEWGVKAYASEHAREEVPAARAASGAEYLRRRRAARDRAADDEGVAHEAAERLHDAAAALAVDTRRHRLHAPALTGRTDRMVLNGAYLVPSGDEARWRAALADSGADLLTVEVTGPWVPYSFVSTGEDR